MPAESASMIIDAPQLGVLDLTAGEKLALEEYKALRAENLALATALTTTTWAAVIAFLGTCGAYVTSQSDPDPALLVLALLIESLVASVIFLQQLWKYIRTGIYIRTRIERVLASNRLNDPMFWEQWISSARARALYYVSIAMLQLPTLGAFSLLVLVHAEAISLQLPQNLWRLHFSDETYTFARAAFANQAWRRMIEAVVLLDVILVAWMSWRAGRDERYAEQLSIGALEPPLDSWQPPESLSIVVPTKNDSRLPLTLHTLTRLARFVRTDVEILVCGETNLGIEAPTCKFVHVIGAAKGSCVRAGLEKARYPWVVVCDADLPVTPRDLVAVADGLRDADVAWGNRYLPESGFLLLPPLFRRVASRGFRWRVRRRFPELFMFDTQCGVKAFRREVGQQLSGRCLVGGLAFDVELALAARDSHVRVRHVPVLWKHRDGSTISLRRDSKRMLREIKEIARRRSVPVNESTLGA